MAEHSPGDPLFAGNMPSTQEALPASHLFVMTQSTEGIHLGGGHGRLTSVPVVRATYRSYAIPFQPLRTQYQS